MSNNQPIESDEVKYVPKLRFTEFRNTPWWTYKNGNEIFEAISNKKHNSDLPILAITQEYGAIPRNEIDYTVIVTDKSVEGYKVVEKGDFIISLRSFQGGIEYSDYKGICSPAYIILRKQNTKNIDAFFKHYLKTDLYIRQLNLRIEGLRDGKMVSFKQFSEIPLPLPLPQEQEKIAVCLTSIDDLIQIESSKLENLTQHKKALLLQMFPKNSESLPKLRFNEFNSNWEETSSEKIFSRIKTKNLVGERNVLTISAQKGLISQEEYFNKSVSSKDVSGYYLIKKGEFAYNKSYSSGYPMGAIKKLSQYEQGVVSPLYICFSVEEKTIDSEFFQYLCDSGVLNSELSKIAQEGARNHGLLNIGLDDFFKNIFFKFPNKIEQQKIASCISSIENLITHQSNYVEQLKKHKKGLIQQLFPMFEDVPA